jgi:hypothetical protein
MGAGSRSHALDSLPRETDHVSILEEAEWAPGPFLTGAESLSATGIRFPNRPASIINITQ